MKTTLILVLSLFVCGAWADQPNSPRYTFSWQLGQANAPAPRGGSTRGPQMVDQAGLFRKLFEYADQLASGQTPPQSIDAVIHESLAEMGAPVGK